eukprot:Gb_16166 [translate_table: standard]
MCQPHQLWIFPDFSRIRDESDSRRRLQNAMVLQQITEEEYLSLHEAVGRFHSLTARGNQCCSMVIRRIHAPVSVVWSVVRRFDEPQTYKHFIRSCFMRGDGNVGSMREVRVVSGLPAERSTERLEILDDERHIISFRVVGGVHRLNNYRSVTTLHDRIINGRPGTIVIESYVVDVPENNSRDDTCVFADTIVKLNLASLAQVSEDSARHHEGRGSPGI